MTETELNYQYETELNNQIEKLKEELSYDRLKNDILMTENSMLRDEIMFLRDLFQRIVEGAILK